MFLLPSDVRLPCRLSPMSACLVWFTCEENALPLLLRCTLAENIAMLREQCNVYFYAFGTFFLYVSLFGAKWRGSYVGA